MSDQIKHECGIALIRLLKPLDYYQRKYGTLLYGMNKLRLLLQKQRNRGQDGAGVATIKLNPKPGTKYINRERNTSANYLEDIFKKIYKNFQNIPPHKLENADWMKQKVPFTGELLLGHLRYGTHGDNSKNTCHPFWRRNNWISRNLVVAGNFNMTNNDEIYEELLELGQYPVEKSDTVTVLEKIGHFLDDEVQRLHNWYKPDGYTNVEITKRIIQNIDIGRLLRKAAKSFDGGYVMAGLIGHGDAFVMRDPNGIRPAFYYHDDEIAVVASERPAIQTALNIRYHQIKELPNGQALIIKQNGKVSLENFTEPKPKRSCSFERIYFSRGTDRDIYMERKKLGEQLTNKVLEAVDYDLENTVFAYVPNTAETAFNGLIEGINNRLDQIKKERILALGGDIKPKKLEKILSMRPRVEKIVVKDAKLRTFIADDASRSDLVSHVYDVTYGIVQNEKDTLVLIDDSIVRGTTMRKSILSTVARLKPKKVIIVSSAPQIRYPDCYGIDMSVMKDFVAFRALVELLEEHDKMDLLEATYDRCKKQFSKKNKHLKNEVIALYDVFPYEQISAKIAEIVTPKNIKPKVEVIYQTLEGLHKACPNHSGDWYFSGNYPTDGGTKVANKAFMNYMEKSSQRAY